MSKTQDLYTHAKRRMPGGVGLLSKRPEMFAPGRWPGYAARARGCEIWDLDGVHYYDMTTNGIGACILGYADPDVSAAVKKRVDDGSMTSLNPPEEVWLADRLCGIHPWADCARFARTGGEICAIAVRIARATTGRDLVAFSGYHGWSDWYIAANLSDDHQLDGQLLPGIQPNGVPRSLTGTCIPFQHGDTAAFDALIREYGDRLACVIMEPARGAMPAPGFLEHVRDEIHRVGGLLIFDEVTIAWRMNFGGVHKLLGVVPDMAVFAKALGNGHPIAAVIGTRAAMDGAHESFISSTYWTEGVGPAAALATLDKMERTRVWEHITRVGETVQRDWRELAARHGLRIHTSGFPCLAHFDFEENKLELKTLYTRLMLEKDFLANTAIYPTLAHTDAILDEHRAAIDEVFARIAQIEKSGGREAILRAIGGEVCQSDFKRLIDG